MKKHSIETGNNFDLNLKKLFKQRKIRKSQSKFPKRSTLFLNDIPILLLFNCLLITCNFVLDNKNDSPIAQI